MTVMTGVHPAANEAAIRHANAKLAEANLELTVAVGNLRNKDEILDVARDEIARLDKLVGEYDDLAAWVLPETEGPIDEEP